MADLVSTIDVNTIILTIVSSALTLLGAWIKKEYNRKNRTATIREVVEDCVKYVEQKSKTTPIENKYLLAKDKAQNILKSKKINITDDIYLETVHTPGHTPGGICLYSKLQKLAFTGDTLFEDGLGRTDLEGGNEDLMKKSVSNKISLWEDDITIYPGHGNSVSMKELRRRGIMYLK